MSVEGDGVELGEDVDPVEVGIQAVADGDVDQPVFPADEHGWFSPVFRERV